MSIRQRLKIFVAMVFASLVLFGCTSPNGSGLSGNVTAVGSTALQPLLERVVPSFTDKNPNVIVTIQGGGSGTGLTQVSSGNVAIGNSDIFAEEKKGIDASKLEDHLVAVTGMGPVVNKGVKVDNLTMDQLRGIFTGKIKNWKEVGGQDLKITVINRPEGSGTRATFENDVFKPGDVAVNAQAQDSSGTVQKIVSSTPGAISYLSFSYFNDKVKALSIDNVKPESKNIYSNDWKIWSYEHMYTPKDGDTNALAFIKHVQSDEGQAIIEKMGYGKVNEMKVKKDAEGKITPIEDK